MKNQMKLLLFITAFSGLSINASYNASQKMPVGMLVFTVAAAEQAVYLAAEKTVSFLSNKLFGKSTEEVDCKQVVARVEAVAAARVEAATKINKFVRGYFGRKRAQAAARINRVVRGSAGRKRAQAARVEAAKVEAATKINRVVRGSAGRKRAQAARVEAARAEAARAEAARVREIQGNFELGTKVVMVVTATGLAFKAIRSIWSLFKK